MTTVSVPLNKKQEDALDTLVAQGVADNRAALMRKALEKLAEDEAIRAVLEAEQEIADGKIISTDVRTALRGL